MIHNTVRLETDNGLIGTGFFMQLRRDRDPCGICIVTNKHVISGATSVKFLVPTCNPEFEYIPGACSEFTIPDICSVAVPHPDPEVDLCIIPVDSMIENSSRVTRVNNKLFKVLAIENIPDSDVLAQLSEVEEVYMIGYPAGFMDEYNTIPIVRKGVTATPCYLSTNGRPEFFLDICLIGGSSGSPIRLANKINDRHYLIGIAVRSHFITSPCLYSHPDDSLVNLLGSEFKIVTNQSVHLGIAIKSTVLLDFVDITESWRSSDAKLQWKVLPSKST